MQKKEINETGKPRREGTARYWSNAITCRQIICLSLPRRSDSQFTFERKKGRGRENARDSRETSQLIVIKQRGKRMIDCFQTLRIVVQSAGIELLATLAFFLVSFPLTATRLPFIEAGSSNKGQKCQSLRKRDVCSCGLCNSRARLNLASRWKFERRKEKKEKNTRKRKRAGKKDNVF